MNHQEEKQQLRNKLLKVAMIFVLSYAISLGVWIGVGKYYGYIVTYTAALIVAPIKSIKLDKVKFDPNDKYNISTYFRTQKTFSKNIGMLQNVNFGHFTFNIPITIAILAAFFPFISKYRIYVEATIILVLIHLIYVVSLEGFKLTEALMKSGYEQPDLKNYRSWQFAEGFVKSMVLRFEPFLIGAYIYFSRNRGKVFESSVEKPS